MTEQNKDVQVEEPKLQEEQLLEKIKGDVKSQMEDFKTNLPEYVTESDLEKKLEIINQSIKDVGKDEELKTQFNELQKTVQEYGLELKKLNDKEPEEKHIPLEQKVSDILRKNTDELALFKTTDKKDRGLALNLKATVQRSAVSSNTQAHRVDGIGEIQRRKVFMRDLFTPGRIAPNNHGSIRYVDQQAITDGATNITEGNAYPTTSDISWIERSINIQKVGDSIKATRESMDDIDYVESQINNFLMKNVELRVDAQLLSGTGVAPQLKGVQTSATAFAAGGYATSVQDAQLADLAAIIGAQIMTGTNYMPNAILMHPEDMVKRFMLVKDAENEYIKVPFAINTPDGLTIIANMVVVANSGVTQNTLYVGDFKTGTVYSSDEVQIEFGFENDDFTKDLVTIKARERMALLIRIVDNGAYRYVSDIGAALAAIDNTP